MFGSGCWLTCTLVAGQEVEEVEEELRPIYDERELTELVSGLTLFLEHKHTLVAWIMDKAKLYSR